MWKPKVQAFRFFFAIELETQSPATIIKVQNTKFLTVRSSFWGQGRVIDSDSVYKFEVYVWS